MASSRSTVDAELSQLTPSQRDALHQFTAVTDQQPAAALPLLRRCQWNVQVRSCPSPTLTQLLNIM